MTARPAGAASASLEDRSSKARSSLPRVVIVGGGFAGLAAAKALSDAPVRIILLDRRNHHVFQPLLYQVATASLSPADISAPIRTVLHAQDNCEIALAHVVSIDVANRRVMLENGSIEYDYLILAAGATHAYFGHDDWAAVAPGLKTIEDAIQMRRRILLAFETAEYERSEEERRAVLTFGIVGAGPTGVELAGAIKEIAGQTLPQDYKRIDTRTTRVLLFEAGDRVLPSFPPRSSSRAKRDLERIGVEVRLRALVTNITDRGIYVGDEFIALRNVFWAAGVRANPLGQSLGAPLDRAGRVIVEPDLSIPGHPEVFVTGDLAAAKSADTGKPVPGVAQGGIQMGRHAGRTIAREVRGRSRRTAPPNTSARNEPASSGGARTDAGGATSQRSPKVGSAGVHKESISRIPFIYHDKGSMAVIGNAKAIVQIGKFEAAGFFAWWIWGAIHIAFLIGFRNRLQVLFSWFWSWLLKARDARLITGETEPLDTHPAPLPPSPSPLARASSENGPLETAPARFTPHQPAPESLEEAIIRWENEGGRVF